MTLAIEMNRNLLILNSPWTQKLCDGAGEVIV